MINFLKLYRVSNWSRSLIPIVLGYIFFFVFYFRIPISFEFSGYIFIFLISAVGLAAFGFFLNDLFDKKTDLLAGKNNQLQKLSFFQSFLLLMLSLGVSISPWFFLPASDVIIGLICLQFICYFIYSAPFPRFKAKPFFSNILDALYAYLIPFLITGEFMVLFSNSKLDYQMIAGFMAMLFLVGYLNLFIHQLMDMQFDRTAKIHSTPIFLGIERSQKMMQFLIGFVLLSILISFSILMFQDLIWGCAILVFLFVLNQIIYTFKNSNTISIQREIEIGLLLNYFFQFYLPVLWLIFLSFRSPFWLFVLLIFLFLFQNKNSLIERLIVFMPIFRVSVRLLKKLKLIASFVVNFCIYWLFRLVGVDLIRENKSAIQFLKQKWIR